MSVDGAGWHGQLNQTQECPLERWCRERGSNPRPSDVSDTTRGLHVLTIALEAALESDALPTTPPRPVPWVSHALFEEIGRWHDETLLWWTEINRCILTPARLPVGYGGPQNGHGGGASRAHESMMGEER